MRRGSPPLFIWTTTDDDIVPSEHALALYAAARALRVPVELHLYDDQLRGGEHAQGLALDNPQLRGWSSQMLAWLGPAFARRPAT